MRCLCRLCIAIALCCCFLCQSLAQDIASRASGYWDDPQTWNGGVVPAALSSGQITVATGHDVVLRDVRVIDQLTVSAGATLRIASSGVMQLRDGPGTDLVVSGTTDVEGTLECQQGASLSSSSVTLFFHQGAHYHHQYTTTEGSLPLASWDTNSVIEISGYTSFVSATANGNWGQNFGTMTWNTPNLQAVFDLGGHLDHLAGDLIIQSTGAHRLLLSSASLGDTVRVDGNLELYGNASLELTSSSLGDLRLVVGLDMLVNTSGVFSFANQGRGLVQLHRDFSITNGTISESGTGTGEFLFANSRRHIFSRGASGLNGVFNGRINYTIAAADTLDLLNTVLSAGIGTNNGNTLAVSGTIIVGSTDVAGAIQNNTTGGNIRTTVSLRQFNPGSRVIYSSAEAQYLGNSGGAAGINTEVVIDNPNGVSLSANIVIPGSLSLRSGSLVIGAGRTLTLSGIISRNSGRLEGTSTSALMIADSIPGHRDIAVSSDRLTLGTFTIDRRADGASVSLLSDILTGQLNLMAGELINNDRITLIDNGMMSRWSRASIAGQEVSVEGDGQYNVTYRTNSVSAGPFAKIYSGIELPVAANKLKSLIIATGQSLDTVVLTKDITINNLLDMNRGRFYVQHHTINFKGTVWSDDTGNFGQGTGTVLFSDSTSIQGSSNPVFNSIQTLSGSNVRFARNISVSGNIAFSPGSVVDAASITITLNGSTSQSLNTNGTAIGNITVSKSNQSHVELHSALPLRGILRFNTPSSNVEFRSNGFLTLLSVTDTATTTFGNAMIYRLQNGNTVTGDVTVQRFLSGEGRIYRYLSSPVANGTVADWKDDFSITGNFSDPSPAENICGSMVNRNSPSLYYYDESKGATTSSGYVAYPAQGTSALASPLQVGLGYSAFIRQCISPTVVDLTGPINKLQINLPVSYTSGSTMSGWNLVGNPYPCTIDWDIAGTQGWIKTNIAPSIAIRDNGDGGFYRYWDGDGDPSEIVEGRIAPGQGFWVRTLAANPVLAVREGVKVLQTAAYHRERDTTSVMVISLHQGQRVDRTYLKIREGASNTLDSLDCPKLDNVTFDLATYSEDKTMLAINAMENFPCSGEMNLICKDLEAGSYRLESLVKGKFANYEFEIRDGATGVRQSLSDSYSFSLSSSMPLDDKRFTIHWKPRALKAVSLVSTEYTLCDADSIGIGLIDADGDVRYELWEDTVRISENLTLRSSDLDVGIHKLRIHVITNCSREEAGDTIVVTRHHPLLLRSKGDVICNEGVGKLSARAQDAMNVYWYSSVESDSVLAADSIFNTPVIDKTTKYYASAEAGGCESKRQEVIATVVSFIPVSIIREGNLLTSSMRDGNEWFLNGERLTHEDGASIWVTSDGLYSVRNRVEACVTVDSIKFDKGRGALGHFYPNPVESHFTVASDFDDLASVQLLNTLGQTVAEIDVQAVGREKIGIFDASKLKAGLYFLRLVTVGRKEEILMVVKK